MYANTVHIGIVGNVENNQFSVSYLREHIWCSLFTISDEICPKSKNQFYR